MKIIYGIAGFVIGILSGLLVGLAEMKWIVPSTHSTMLPFVIGITIIFCAIAGVRIGIKMANKELNRP